MEKKPYTPEEEKVHDLLMQANDLFMQLPEQHPADVPIWVDAIHQQQHTLSIRILRRDYPNHFITIEK